MSQYKNCGYLNQFGQTPAQKEQWDACDHKKEVVAIGKNLTAYRCETCKIEAKLDSGD